MVNDFARYYHEVKLETSERGQELTGKESLLRIE